MTGLSCLIGGFLLGKSGYSDQVLYITHVSRSTGSVTQPKLTANLSNAENAQSVINPVANAATSVATMQHACNVFDLTQKSNDKSECLKTRWRPSFYICIHPVQKDIHVSGSIKRNGMWEGHVVSVFQRLLQKDPALAVIDIGANIGLYSLLGTMLNRPVVAVEARERHVQMIHHAV